jgi:hypothetical protein
MLGLMVVGLLAVAAVPAMAQTADPLGLISSGAVLPYFGSNGTTAFGSTTNAHSEPLSPGSMSFLEVAAPVIGNLQFHMFFFSANCTRGPESVGLPLTTNDVQLFRLDYNNTQNPVDGLVTAANVDQSGFALTPISIVSPLHVRVLWVNVGEDFMRTLEPIALNNAEALSINGTWNPMRTGATFYAPLDGNGISTTIYFICPRSTIATGINSPANVAFPDTLFPALIPRPNSSTTPLRLRVYDDEEGFLRDVQSACDCLTVKAVTDLSPVYADASVAPFGTYTEVEGGDNGGGATDTLSFTGYRAIRLDGAAGIGGGDLDLFGRLNGGNKFLLRGDASDFGGR